MDGNKIRASYVDQRIISLQTFRNRKLRIRKFTGTQKILKLVRTNQRKYTRCRKTSQIKAIHRRYTRIRHLCIPMQKVLG